MRPMKKNKRGLPDPKIFGLFDPKALDDNG